MFKKTTVPWVLGALLLTAVSTAKADNLQLFINRADFGGDDVADWGQLGPCSTSIPNPFSATSVSGLGITGVFDRGVGQVVVQTVCGWFGNFASGDVLVWTNAPSGRGPLTLSFSAPIVGAGAKIQADDFGPFTGLIEAFSGDVSLGFVTEDGNSTPRGDNSAIFIGVKDLDGPNITSLVISLTAAPISTTDFAINQLSLQSI